MSSCQDSSPSIQQVIFCIEGDSDRVASAAARAQLRLRAIALRKDIVLNRAFPFYLGVIVLIINVMA
jgi:hypothetical protein